MTLTEQTLAPNFTAQTNGGNTISLSDYKGKWVILYFYPKDNTTGCTKEACDFNDNFQSITAKNTVVLGVSPDDVKSHDKFVKDFSLSFQLISDPEKTICNQYGVWGEKSMYGRKYMGVLRTTFIIDPKGTIQKIYEKVTVTKHVKTVIKDLEQLQSISK